MLNAFKLHANRTRQKLRGFGRGSKKWWKVSHQLLSHVHKPTSSPLKRPDGTWALSAGAKADLFARAFNQKWRLPAPVVNEFSDCSSVMISPRRWQACVIRTRSARAALSSLRQDSGTGPDLLPARVLKQCSASLAVPVAKLARLILRSGLWPLPWREHWVHPLYKKLAVSCPDNYRGIQLTAQLSKVVERMFLQLFSPQLDRFGAYGARQFAYTPGRGARDAVLYFVLQCISAFTSGRRVLLYCSDVSGAFDRVDVPRLLAKLRGFSVPESVVGVLASWLEQRTARVIVQGKHSAPVRMENMIYQGTVLGPPLWNAFYSDSCMAVRATGFEEIVYADDLNAIRSVEISVTDDQAHRMMAECQTSLHRWGAANRVVFDPGKESTHILSRSRPWGDSFKLLGIIFDTRFLMHEAILACVSDCGWKIQSLLRCRRFYNSADILLLYKAQVLSFIEYRTCAFHFASSSVLAPLDAIQHSFLRSLNISDLDALNHFALAPLCARRDIAMLGVIHRSVLGLSPRHFASFFRSAPPPPPRSPRRHARHLADPLQLRAPDFARRSVLGLVSVYNLLPDMWSLLRQFTNFNIVCKL